MLLFTLYTMSGIFFHFFRFFLAISGICLSWSCLVMEAPSQDCCSASLANFSIIFVLGTSVIAFGDGVVIFLVSFVDDETLLTVIVVPVSSKRHVMLYY